VNTQAKHRESSNRETHDCVKISRTVIKRPGVNVQELSLHVNGTLCEDGIDNCLPSHYLQQEATFATPLAAVFVTQCAYCSSAFEYSVSVACKCLFSLARGLHQP
jgi:hypothetical protein